MISPHPSSAYSSLNPFPASDWSDLNLIAKFEPDDLESIDVKCMLSFIMFQCLVTYLNGLGIFSP